MKNGGRNLLFLILWLGSLAITLSSLVYFNSEERAPFVIEKLPLAWEGLYVLLLRIHVVSASLALPGCLILTSQSILKRWPKFHRYCGRVVGFVVIFGLVPTGFYLAFYARGAWPGTLGFLLTGAIALGAMLKAIAKARAGQYAEHRRFAWHVLGQLSVAVTSRAMLFGLESFNFDPDFAYLLSLWVPVLGTFAFVEILHLSKKPFPFFLKEAR